ncbi:MAG TPA: hypothetical protein VFC33_09530 [Acidimicrobiia bacterium]|nr:hypothetical protein [Acidimicrobiia bacterium]
MIVSSGSEAGMLHTHVVEGARRVRRRARIRRRRMRGGVGVLLALGLVLVPFTSADALVAWNGAMAFTALYHQTDADVSFQVRTGRGPGVGVANTAFALSAYCQECHTVAIAVQIDLVSGTVVGVDARNRAEARNWNCVACDTLASAEQFVVAPGGEVVLTRQARRDLRMIEWQLRMLAHSGQTSQQMQPSIDALMNRIVQVLETELVVVTPASPSVSAPSAPAAPSSGAPAIGAPPGAPASSTPAVTVQHTGGTVVAHGPNESQQT